MAADDVETAVPLGAGLKEHHERIQTFLDLARETKDQVIEFRLHMACVYSARAIVELILEAAHKGRINASREDLKVSLLDRLRWFNLIERIRIHDFHRFGVRPPHPEMHGFFLGGPLTLTARSGTALYRFSADKPETETTGGSSIAGQRPLVSSDGRFFDEDTSTFVGLKRIIEDFLLDVPEVIREFEDSVS
ncbi:MAG: hypothetical protein GY851_08950 [bacterium]|nr:hypothetical protein [bacterium]